MTAPNSTDDTLREKLKTFQAKTVANQALGKPYMELVDEAEAAIQAEVQIQFLLGKLEAYKNVVSWEESYGDNPVLSALAAHQAAVRDIEYELAALQQGDK